jgi:hypothetical protein
LRDQRRRLSGYCNHRATNSLAIEGGPRPAPDALAHYLQPGRRKAGDGRKNDVQERLGASTIGAFEARIGTRSESITQRSSRRSSRNAALISAACLTRTACACAKRRPYRDRNVSGAIWASTSSLQYTRSRPRRSPTPFRRPAFRHWPYHSVCRMRHAPRDPVRSSVQPCSVFPHVCAGLEKQKPRSDRGAFASGRTNPMG